MSTRIAGRHGDGYFPVSATLEQMATAWRAAKQEAPPGKRLSLAFYTTVNVTSDQSRGQRELEEFVERYYGAPFARMASRQGCVAGTADACMDWLTPFIELGVDHIILRIGSHDQATQFQRVVTELLPRLRELRPG